MFIYVICFIISVLLFYLAYKINGVFLKKIFVIIAILIPSILAGLRYETIGTDINVYVKPIYEIATHSSSFVEYYSTRWNNGMNKISQFEIGFVSLIYVIAKVFKNFQVVLFFIELIICLFLYLGLRKYSFIKKYIWLGMLVFYAMFYNISLNIMRQFIGISIAFWGLSSIINKEEKCNIKFIISTVVSILFHKSCVLGLFVFAIYKIMNSKYKSEKRIKIINYYINVNKLLTFVIIIIGIIITNNLSLFFDLFKELGVNKYNNYIKNGVLINVSMILKMTPIIFVFFVVKKNFLEDVKDAWFYVVVFCLNYFVINNLNTTNMYADRIGYIFQIFNVISFPLLMNSVKIKNNKNIISFIMISFLFLYWWHCFIYHGWNQTYPYRAFWA